MFTLLCNHHYHQFSSVQSLSCVRLFVTPWTTARQGSLSITKSQSLPKLMAIKSVMPSNHLILCCPFFSCVQSFPTSGSFPVSQLFPSSGQNTGVSASTSVLPMNIQDWSPLGLDWLELLAFQGAVKSLLQHQVQKHQFFGAQLSFGEGNGTPLQYSCLENPMDRGAW